MKRLILLSAIAIAFGLYAVAAQAQMPHRDWYLVNSENAVCAYVPSYFSDLNTPIPNINDPQDYINLFEKYEPTFKLVDQIVNMGDGSEGVIVGFTNPKTGIIGGVQEFFTSLTDCGKYIALAETKGTIKVPNPLQ